MMVVAASAVVCAIAVAPAHAAGKGKGNNNGSSAVIGYEIDPDSCAVSVTSTKDISNVVIQDADGNQVEKFDDLSGHSFDLGNYTALLTEGTLHVKSGNNGNRGLGPDVGDEFREELAACLEPDCPFIAEIDEFQNAGSSISLDLSNVCQLRNTEADFLNVADGRPNTFTSDFNGSVAFSRLLDFRGSNECVDIAIVPQPQFARFAACTSGLEPGQISPEEARACAVEMGCTNFNIPD